MSKIEMYDRGDRSVGIAPSRIEIDTNIHYDKKEYKQFYNLARDWFDLGGTITVCIGGNKSDMECYNGKQGIYDKEPIFWKEEKEETELDKRYKKAYDDFCIKEED